MRLYEFSNDTYNEIKIPEEQIQDYLEETCPIACSAVPIYRGWSGISTSVNMFYCDSANFERKAANTTNNYNLLMSYYLPSWKNYPKRSRSFICSGSNFKANMYGDYGIVYRCFPINNPLIGVCPAADLWTSFKSINYGDLENIERMLCETFDELASNGVVSIVEINNSIQRIQTLMKAADLCWSHNDKSKYIIFQQFVEDYSGGDAEKNLFQKYKSFSEFIDKLLNPKLNRFKLDSLSSLNDINNKEVWFSGPAYFLAQ